MPPSDPNEAPLPPFLDARGDAGSVTPAPPAPPASPPGTSEKPVRTVELAFTPPASGEAALAGLPVTALTKRRLGWIAAAFVSLWVLALFVRQVGDASAGQARADQIRSENGVLATRVEALAAEKELIGGAPYIGLMARGYGLGGSKERVFVLAAGAPSLPPDAPGSAGLRVGHTEETGTPLDSWLEILFGPER